MSLLPVRLGRLNDEAFLVAFRNRIESELLEEVTHPAAGYGPDASTVFNRFQSDGQLPLGDKLVRGMFVRCCQEIRLTSDEIEELQSRWFS